MMTRKALEVIKALAINNNKKSNFEIIIDDDDKLKSLGLEKVSIINKNVIINLPDGQTVISKFKIDNLEGTLKSLNNKLIDKGINGRTIERLELLLTDKILQRINELERQKDEPASTTDVQKIKEEIEKDRISIGQISVEEWQAGLLERYQKLQKTVNLNLSKYLAWIRICAVSQVNSKHKRLYSSFCWDITGPSKLS
jgi:hypothetical protein